MASRRLILAALAAGLAGGAYLYWRNVWFFRNPGRRPSREPGLVSPADGTVVYVKRVAPGEDVVVIKQGVAATVQDIVREDIARPKLVIGVFMSPFDVHYNRAPLDGKVEFVRRHPALGGSTFGMIRIGSQVDLVVTWRDDFEVRVTPGDVVRAGETILVR